MNNRLNTKETIKYKGFILKTGEIVDVKVVPNVEQKYVEYIVHSPNGIDLYVDINLDDIVLLRYSGYNDFNNKEIYSYDMVTLLLKDGEKFYGVVKEEDRKWIVEHRTPFEIYKIDLDNKNIVSILKRENELVFNFKEKEVISNARK